MPVIEWRLSDVSRLGASAFVSFAGMFLQSCLVLASQVPLDGC
jgi:hypothetical protein